MFAPTAGLYPRPTPRLSAPLLRVLVLVTLLALLLGALVTPSALRPTPAPAASLADLPVTAQAAISATLGRDDAAYHASAQAGGVELANPNHGLRARFEASGLTLSAGASSGTLTLRGYGYGEALAAPLAATPTAAANRVDYTRGDLREWYVNGPMGLEQGFTLAAPPAGARTGPLAMALEFNGWHATLDADGQGARLTSAAGAQLRYSGLFAYDADGRALTAWMEQRGAELWLRVDDAGARYPLTIDPGIAEPKLTASDGAASDSLGLSVAIDGDTIVVGAGNANSGQGAAYVFVKPVGGWAGASETAKLTASDGAAGDSFGGLLPLGFFAGPAVAVSGDTVVVGAYGADVGGNPQQGAAYVFVKPVGGWVSMTETAKLTASDGAAGDSFGSVAIDGATVVVGAYFATVGGNPQQGAAYVFVKPGSGWAGASETAKLTASDGAAGDFFGDSVAISGSTVVVGAPQLFSGGPGTAYVFVKPAGGWAGASETAKLTASDGAGGDILGVSVAIDGATVVVGAAFAEIGGNTFQGAAYVFVKPGSGWAGASETAKLTASDGAGGDNFGLSVAIDGATVVVGAPFATVGGNSAQGAAYVFAKTAGGWAGASETARLTASDGAASDSFGFSVAISGATVVVGAPYATVGGNSGQGAAYVFETAPADETAPTISITTPANGATYTLGQAVNAGYSCQDEAGGSGLASCDGTVPNGSAIDTSSVGAKTFTVNAADNAGNTSTLSHSYSVAYAFSGFFAPVDNPPVLNQVNAGRSIPMKFSLGGNQGLNIIAAGYPVSQQITCDGGAPVDVIEETSTANSGLTYDPATGQYNYVWKTQKSWAGICRQFTLRLTDGTDHIALFKFK